MLSRSHRLSTAQFNQVIKGGKIFHSPLFRMQVLEAGKGPVHIAAVVPVKIGKTAVIRNSLRRKTYETVRPLILSIKDGLNVILFAKTIDMTSALIPNDLKSLFVKAGVLR